MKERIHRRYIENDEFTFFIGGELLTIIKEVNESNIFWLHRASFILNIIKHIANKNELFKEVFGNSIKDSYFYKELITYSWIHSNKLVYNVIYSDEIEYILSSLREI